MLLATAAPDEAAEVAGQWADDQQLAAPLRTEAFQLQLITASDKEAQKISLAAIRGTDTARKELATKYLALGANELRSMSNGLYFQGSINFSSVSRTAGTPIVPKPPDGLMVEDVRPLLSDSDAEVAACAGYLLVLLGESDGMEPLLRYWRQHAESRDEWSKLVYRAIAVADDSQQIAVLREIYGKLQQYEMSEFYWTIRIMSGSEILKFRKQIRDEVGASRLQ